MSAVREGRLEVRLGRVDERRLDELMQTGLYRSRAEVVREGLIGLHQATKMKERRGGNRHDPEPADDGATR